MAKNEPKWPINDPNGAKWPKMIQNCPKMAKNDPNDPKWPKNGQK